MMGKVLGFTGTRHGMTEKQKIELAKILRDGVTELHHGMCKGADEECHNLARAIGGIWIVGHPPKNTYLMADLDIDEMRGPQEYLARDENIVEETDELVAAPHGMQEMIRSGTWTTVRYAQQHDKWATIIFPDGSIVVR